MKSKIKDSNVLMSIIKHIKSDESPQSQVYAEASFLGAKFFPKEFNDNANFWEDRLVKLYKNKLVEDFEEEIDDEEEEE